MRILLVAPSQASLPQSTQEVEAVVNSGLTVNLLQSNVSQRDLIREMGTPGKYDVLWLATHGDASGIMLTSEIVTPSAIVSIVRGSGVKLVFLNTCSSIATATAIQNEANVDVICTITDVPDIEAYRTGALFATKLLQLGSFRRAYELSKPGRNSTYVYLSGAGPVENGKSEFEQLRKTVDEIEAASRARDNSEVHRKTAELAVISKRIDAHDGEIGQIKGDVDHVKRRMTDIEDHVYVPPKVIVWRMMAIVSLAIGLIVFAVEDLKQLFLPTISSAIFVEIGIISLAAIFWYVGCLTAKQNDKSKEFGRE